MELTLLSGDGGESIRPATNFPGIVVDPNRVNPMVGKSGLGPDRSTERGMPVAH